MSELLNSINWIDITFIILFLGMIYKGARTGVGSQLLSLAGWVVLLFCSINYYQELSTAIFGFLLQRLSRPFSFFAISVVILFLIKTFERLFHVISGDGVAFIERIGGVIIAAIRAFILFGIVGLFMLLIPLNSANKLVEESRFAMPVIDFDLRIYSWLTGRLDFVENRDKDAVLKEFLTPPVEKKKEKEKMVKNETQDAV